MKADTLRPELKEKINEWLISFHRLDPRYKILTFFNQVASDGADNFVEEEDWYDLGRGNEKDPRSSTEELLNDIFNASSMLTVWRPTSNDAMRKMMEGSGVGKGLDIKGKSAQKGLLSAFVPFMQIFEENDKVLIQPIPVNAKLRVYYSSEPARQKAIQTFQLLGCDDAEQEDDVIPSKTKIIDKYTEKNKHGLELSQRLFWEAYVKKQDISRGDDTATGRPSVPGFQDANLKTLKIACSTVPEPAPMPVVFQFDPDQAMRPQTLLMAYEENGTVVPVVSDFDGFLLGWRREALWFGCNLPREQEDLMMWCIDHIEQILDDQMTTDSWTIRWLEVLKKEASKGFIPQMPEYGFGDPKSYSIMEQAALRLLDTGAVRHGSECFNYCFPQEIDDVFLIISDTFRPVPWKYVNVEDLQQTLSRKIAQGFVFPLNPKWVLCDPGWKKLYDELMASQALYADSSRDVWYPPFLGVREKIEEIYKKHPNGFQQLTGRVSFDAEKGYSPLRQYLERGAVVSGNTAYDLAELELEDFSSRKMTLARQIQAASLEELPDKFDEDSGVASKRSMFRKQKDERKSSSEGKSLDDRDPMSTPDNMSRRSLFASKLTSSKNEQRRNFTV
jgi:hypothetical protein